MATQVSPEATQAKNNPPEPKAHQGKGWVTNQGKVSTSDGSRGFSDEGMANLTYSNPFGQVVERAWYNGQIVFALVGEKMPGVEKTSMNSAKEYQPVYSVELDENGWMTGHQPVPGQLNIYATVPGQPDYTGVWKFYYVIVPNDYKANSLRSEEDCKKSGYDIRQSNFYRN